MHTRHASPKGRPFLQAKTFSAKYAVNICSAQENDFNCVIKLDVDAASGRNDWGEVETSAVPLRLLNRGRDCLFAETLPWSLSFLRAMRVLRKVREDGGRGLVAAGERRERKIPQIREPTAKGPHLSDGICAVCSKRSKAHPTFPG